MLLPSPPEIATLTLKYDKGGFEQSAKKAFVYALQQPPLVILERSTRNRRFLPYSQSEYGRSEGSCGEMFATSLVINLPHKI